MSGADKYSPFSRFQADFSRYFGNGAPPALSQQSPTPSISATVPPSAPHPFIAHFYPLAAGIEQSSSGYPHSTNSISQQQSSSAAALVALAASGCVGQNLSNQILRNFQSKARILSTRKDLNHGHSEENHHHPIKKQRQQFDVESLTEDKRSPSRQLAPIVPVSSYNTGVHTSPVAAWHQLLRRFRTVGDSGFDPCAAQTQSEALCSYYSDETGSRRPLLDRGIATNLPPQNESYFAANDTTDALTFSLAQSMQANPREQGPMLDQQIKNQPGLSKDVIQRCSTIDCSSEIANQRSPLNRDPCVILGTPLSTNGRSSSASSVQSDETPRIRRRKRSSPAVETCPVCGITVRPSEVNSHLQQELDSLERISSETKKKSTIHRRTSLERRSSIRQEISSATSSTSNSKRLSDRDLSPKTNRTNRMKTYQKVRSNRVERMNARVGHCVPSHVSTANSLAMFGAGGHLWSAPTSNGTGGHPGEGATCCPVCSSRLTGSLSTVNDHVESCLRRRSAICRPPPDDEDEFVDVESNVADLPTNCSQVPATASNDDDRSNKSFGSEYEWCGQSRVRASALVERSRGQDPPSGYHLVRPSSPSIANEFLNVEADDSQAFGPAQFSEQDLSECRSRISNSDSHTTSTLTTLQQEKCTTPNAHPSTKIAHSAQSSNVTTSSARGNTSHHSTAIGTSSFDEQTKGERHASNGVEESSPRCMICMDSYTDPLTSIQCWHVYCERCWLRALSVKKLCPQCNAITPADKLRRIFL